MYSIFILQIKLIFYRRIRLWIGGMLKPEFLWGDPCLDQIRSIRFFFVNSNALYSVKINKVNRGEQTFLLFITKNLNLRKMAN